MLQALFQTTDALAPLVLRAVLALVMFPHGAQKALGWFGGYGPSGTLAYFETNLGIPKALGLAAIAAEFLGPVALLLGAGGRVAAFAIAVTMVVAAVRVHAANGFFMNWAGSAAGEGWEYHLAVAGLCLALVITGSGALSVDRWLSR